MNINLNQVLAITLVILSVLTASTAQLTDLVGPGATKIIISFASLSTAILSGILGLITGQASQIRGVAQMPGVDRIVVNKQANLALASLAVDPQQDKIEASPEAQQTVTATANKG